LFDWPQIMIHQLATFLGIVINQSMSEGHKVQLPDFHVKPFLAIFDQKTEALSVTLYFVLY
jgi:hypothetical protein